MFFGPVAVGGTYYLLADSIRPEVIVAGLAPGLIATGILVVNNVRDRQADQADRQNAIGQLEWGCCQNERSERQIYLFVKE